MKYLLIISILLLLISCGKERTFHVKAQKPATGEPYDGLRVVVTSSKTGWNGEKYETVRDGNLGSDVETMINLKIKRNRSYAYAVSSLQFFVKQILLSRRIWMLSL